MNNPLNPFNQHFGHLEDPRKLRPCDHPLINILFITVCAVIAGADDWVEIEIFAQEHKDFLSAFLIFLMEYHLTIPLDAFSAVWIQKPFVDASCLGSAPWPH